MLKNRFATSAKVNTGIGNGEIWINNADEAFHYVCNVVQDIFRFEQTLGKIRQTKRKKNGVNVSLNKTETSSSRCCWLVKILDMVTTFFSEFSSRKLSFLFCFLPLFKCLQNLKNFLERRKCLNIQGMALRILRMPLKHNLVIWRTSQRTRY